MNSMAQATDCCAWCAVGVVNERDKMWGKPAVPRIKQNTKAKVLVMLDKLRGSANPSNPTGRRNAVSIWSRSAAHWLTKR
jgi:hypothetical protein